MSAKSVYRNGNSHYSRFDDAFHFIPAAAASNSNSQKVTNSTAAHSNNDNHESIPLKDAAEFTGEDGEPAQEADGEPKQQRSSRKEKSVLQAKLDKLAVQIGYFGKLSYTW